MKAKVKAKGVYWIRAVKKAIVHWEQDTAEECPLCVRARKVAQRMAEKTHEDVCSCDVCPISLDGHHGCWGTPGDGSTREAFGAGHRSSAEDRKIVKAEIAYLKSLLPEESK